MNSFKLEIYATDGCFYNGDCEHLVFGSADGSRGFRQSNISIPTYR